MTGRSRCTRYGCRTESTETWCSKPRCATRHIVWLWDFFWPQSRRSRSVVRVHGGWIWMCSRLVESGERKTETGLRSEGFFCVEPLHEVGGRPASHRNHVRCRFLKNTKSAGPTRPGGSTATRSSCHLSEGRDKQYRERSSSEGTLQLTTAVNAGQPDFLPGGSAALEKRCFVAVL